MSSSLSDFLNQAGVFDPSTDALLPRSGLFGTYGCKLIAMGSHCSTAVGAGLMSTVGDLYSGAAAIVDAAFKRAEGQPPSRDEAELLLAEHKSLIGLNFQLGPFAGGMVLMKQPNDVGELRKIASSNARIVASQNLQLAVAESHPRWDRVGWKTESTRRVNPCQMTWGIATHACVCARAAARIFEIEAGEQSSKRLEFVEKKAQVAVRDEHERSSRIVLLGASGFAQPDRLVNARELDPVSISDPNIAKLPPMVQSQDF